MASLNVGAVEAARDVRFLPVCDQGRNALISQFPDDDLGNRDGASHSRPAFRFDLGLARFLSGRTCCSFRAREAEQPGRAFFRAAAARAATSSVTRCARVRY